MVYNEGNIKSFYEILDNNKDEYISSFDLKDVKLFNLNLSNLHLKNITFCNVYFWKVNFVNIIFEDCLFEDCIFEDTTLNFVTFDKDELIKTKFLNAKGKVLNILDTISEELIFESIGIEELNIVNSKLDIFNIIKSNIIEFKLYRNKFNELYLENSVIDLKIKECTFIQLIAKQNIFNYLLLNKIVFDIVDIINNTVYDLKIFNSKFLNSEFRQNLILLTKITELQTSKTLVKNNIIFLNELRDIDERKVLLLKSNYQDFDHVDLYKTGDRYLNIYLFDNQSITKSLFYLRAINIYFYEIKSNFQKYKIVNDQNFIGLWKKIFLEIINIKYKEFNVEIDYFNEDIQYDILNLYDYLIFGDLDLHKNLMKKRNKYIIDEDVETDQKVLKDEYGYRSSIYYKYSKGYEDDEAFEEYEEKQIHFDKDKKDILEEKTNNCKKEILSREYGLKNVNNIFSKRIMVLTIDLHGTKNDVDSIYKINMSIFSNKKLVETKYIVFKPKNYDLYPNSYLKSSFIEKNDNLSGFESYKKLEHLPKLEDFINDILIIFKDIDYVITYNSSYHLRIFLKAIEPYCEVYINYFDIYTIAKYKYMDKDISKKMFDIAQYLSITSDEFEGDFGRNFTIFKIFINLYSEKEYEEVFYLKKHYLKET
ncbi:pentapeptide repeat-containing protein [Spiroplasma culicicola]|uniref:SV2A/B/C luminal domain-containing protein n=1 Tax=Spiroplasma culicicola AES-1 TaxID=1276246 RepID=W6A729_9MOLU|nr:hypothetical protein [Spiroplasma culicicola]AHI52771.1 hypothetical protein SCULI_v1c04300 [Spiroplasma culicicola AES-1]